MEFDPLVWFFVPLSPMFQTWLKAYRNGGELTNNLLPPGIVLHELYLAGDIDLALLFMHLFLFRSLGRGTEPTAIVQDIVETPEEGRMAMQIYCPMLGLVPFCIE